MQLQPRLSPLREGTHCSAFASALSPLFSTLLKLTSKISGQLLPVPLRRKDTSFSAPRTPRLTFAMFKDLRSLDCDNGKNPTIPIGPILLLPNKFANKVVEVKMQPFNRGLTLCTVVAVKTTAKH